MDTAVLDALKKWPTVPDCYGWLGLDRRGDWRMRNEFAQENHLLGEVIRHEGLKLAIQRNYAINGLGQFFFQNGPQRVFIDIAYTPWIVRMSPRSSTEWEFKTSFGDIIEPIHCFLDEQGQILIEAFFPITHELSPNDFQTTHIKSVGLLHDHDLELFSQISRLENTVCGIEGSFFLNNTTLQIEPILSKSLQEIYQFVKSPRA